MIADRHLLSVQKAIFNNFRKSFIQTSNFAFLGF